MAKVENFIYKFLLNHGFTEEELSSKSHDEIKKIYTQGITRYIQNFFPKEEEKKEIHKYQNPFQDLQSPDEIFNLSLDFFESFSSEEVILMIHKRFRQIPMDQIQKIVSILFFSFQEKILKEIEQKLSNISRKERESILEIYESQRDHITHLLDINKQLELESFREKLEMILRIKASIQSQKED